jgi:hypothetical protein
VGSVPSSICAVVNSANCQTRVQTKNTEFRDPGILYSTMTLFDEHKPRTHRDGVRQREKTLMKKLSELLEMEDEAELLRALEEDFEIRKGDRRYEQILTIWREEHRRGG